MTRIFRGVMFDDDGEVDFVTNDTLPLRSRTTPSRNTKLAFLSDHGVLGGNKVYSEAESEKLFTIRLRPFLAVGHEN